MNGDILKCKIEIESIRYFKDNWGILSASVIEGSVKGDYEPITDFRGEITIKGNMPTPNAGDRWLLTAEEVEDAKYGLQYNIKSTAEIVDSNTTDKIGQKKFLLTIFTENQVEAMYNTLKDPWDTLYNSRYEELVQVKGIGINNAIKFSEKFNEKVPMSKMYTELEEYALTNTMMKKLLDEYKNPDIVIETVKSNPYKLIDI